MGLFCSFSFAKKKTNQKKSPYVTRPLRATLRFSNRAVAVELANAQTATAPDRPILRCSARHKGETKTCKIVASFEEASWGTRYAGGESLKIEVQQKLNDFQLALQQAVERYGFKKYSTYPMGI